MSPSLHLHRPAVPTRQHAGVPGRPVCAHQGQAEERAAGSQRGAAEREPEQRRVRPAVSEEPDRSEQDERPRGSGRFLQRRGAAAARGLFQPEPLVGQSEFLLFEFKL